MRLGFIGMYGLQLIFLQESRFIVPRSALVGDTTPQIETKSRAIATAKKVHLFTIWYPEVSRTCFPHMEQIPFLNAHPWQYFA